MSNAQLDDLADIRKKVWNLYIVKYEKQNSETAARIATEANKSILAYNNKYKGEIPKVEAGYSIDRIEKIAKIIDEFKKKLAK